MSNRNKQQMIDVLEKKRELLNSRLDARRDRINQRFDQKKAQLDGKLNTKQEQIIAAALELLTEHGLNDLSLRDIAKKLDIKAPAIYWHFKSKSQLVNYMAEAILSREFSDARPRTNDATWQAWLIKEMNKLRKAMLAYPDGGRVVAGAYLYPALTLAQIFEDSLISLTSAGVDARSAFYIITTAVQFTFGFVIEEQAGPNVDELASFNQPSQFAAAYPNLADAVKNCTRGPNSQNRAYAAGLKLIIQ